MLKIGVLVSGGGTNLQAILDAIDAGEITNAKVDIVISNNASAYALERARKHDIEAVCIAPKDYPDREAFHKALLAKLQEKEVDLIVLASDGYPVKYEKGIPIHGFENFKDKDGYYCFHAGTKFKDGEIVTNGGRVLGITAKGETLKEARKNAYAATEWISFANKYMRHDIGKAIDEA